MKTPVIAIITPGTFVVPCATSSSVELVVEQVARRLLPTVRPIVFGKKIGTMPQAEIVEGVRYIRIASPSPSRYIAQVSRKLKRYRADILQVENRPRFVRYLRKQHAHAEICLVLHSITFISSPYISLKELRSCLKSADRIVVNSRFLRAQLIRMCPAARKKIIVIYLGVDTERFASRWSPERASRRLEKLAQLGLADKKIVLYVGRLLRIKGVHHLLTATPDIVRQVPDTVVLVVGSAHYSSSRATPYVRRLKRLGALLPGHVHFIPYVPHSEIADWFQLADVLVVPSDHNEAFGLVNVEAMASGVPVVATRAGGMKEIIGHGDNGWTIEPKRLCKDLAPAVVSLLSQPDLARQMGNNGVQRVQEQFTWERTAERWLDTYIQCILDS